MNEKEDLDLEKFDLNLLKILSEDGRKSFRSLSEDLKKSPITVKKHIEDLEDKGIIKNYGVNIDYERLGYDIIALIEITIAKGKMLEVERHIANDPHVYGVYDITGTYDALILARFKTRAELSKMVKEINSSEFVVRTNTHLILNVIKEGTSFSDLLNCEESENKSKS
ncbi:MAG: winged helix-turn-helix transcriptional regulator [Candidatus Lokiarchaeota archaeon]|nr:winged helix-turn-helix transcriptional regulator [Candidatus Lokiarchaeota archaeon]MBD3340621.1 winged helix-turn-helix transcriptional regulator [Candidatus Lokiarchaeota archaeon]